MVKLRSNNKKTKHPFNLDHEKVVGILSMILLSTSLICAVISVSLSVQARIYSGKVDIEMPQSVVPGGYIIFSTDTIPPNAGGASMYFYLSKNDDPEITSGDILMGKMSRNDVKASNTQRVPKSIGAGEYYFKMTDLSKIGAQCIVSESTIEVITKDLPKITVDPKSGEVSSEVEVKGEDIPEDYNSVELFWNGYETSLGTPPIVDGEFTLENLVIQNAFMGDNAITVLLFDEVNDKYLGTYGAFEVEPSVVATPPAEFSIKANVGDAQYVLISAHGFPKGTIEKNTIEYTLKDFSTGRAINSTTSTHKEVNVNDSAGLEGSIEDLETTLYNLDEGILDIQFQVGEETLTMKDVILSSSPGEPAEFNAKKGSNNGVIGDEVEFWGINFPAGVSIDIDFQSDFASKTFIAGTSDVNGAWHSTITLEEIPGGKYDVMVIDANNGRHKMVGTFEVKPTVDIPDKAVVGELIDIRGEGFLGGSTYDAVDIGGKKVDVDVTIGSDGIFEAFDVEVPHVSGGGQKVAVKILGEKAEGGSITLTTSIVIEPRGVALEALTPTGTWKDSTGETIFAGTPMRFTGLGFKSKESGKVTFENEGGVKKDAVIIYWKADTNGDLDVIFQVPTGGDFSHQDEWTVTIAGKTSGNKWEETVDTENPDDSAAKIYFGLKKDGNLTNEVKGGDSISVIGVGFETSKLTLEFGGVKVKDVTASYGYFNEKITLPKLDKGAYRVKEQKTGARSLIIFVGMPAVFINAPINTIYFIFVDPTYMTSAESTYDAAAGGIVYGLCANKQNLGFDTTQDWLMPSGAINTTTISGAWVLMFGGPAPNVAVRYYEDAGLTPIKAVSNATHYIFSDQSDKVIATLAKSTVASGHEDMFLVETFSDEANTFYVMYGFSWKGTWASGIYFKDVISKNLNSYNKAYYIFHWVDDPKQDGLPQSSEISEYASEK